MTAQIADIVKLNGAEHGLTEVEGTGLFEPSDYNIKIGQSRCTAFRRGYQVNYEVRENTLFLDSMDVCTKHKYEGKAVPFKVFELEGQIKPSFLNRHLPIIFPHRRRKLIERLYTEPIVTLPPPSINGVAPLSESDLPVLEEKHPVEEGIVSIGSFFDYSYSNVNLKVNFTGVFLLGDDFISQLYVHMGNHPAWKYEKVTALCFNNGKLIESKDISGDVAKLRDLMQKEDEEIKEKTTAGWILKCFSSKQTLLMLNGLKLKKEL